MDDQFFAHLYAQIDFISKESKRVKDRTPFDDLGQIITASATILRKLGGLEHEVALAALKEEFVLVKRDAKEDVVKTWLNFWRHQRSARDLIKEEKVARDSGVDYLLSLREHINSLSDNIPDDPVLATMHKSTRDQMEQLYHAMNGIEQSTLSMAPLVKAVAWSGLRVDLQLLAIYLQYPRQRIRVFFTFHAFVILVPVIVLGIIYAKAAHLVFDYIELTYLPSFWFLALLGLLPALIKKYVWIRR